LVTICYHISIAAVTENRRDGSDLHQNTETGQGESSVDRIEAGSGIANVLEHRHHLEEPVQLIPKDNFSRGRIYLRPLGLECLLTLLRRMEELGGKVGVA
jgi:hypothetical protein